MLTDDEVAAAWAVASHTVTRRWMIACALAEAVGMSAAAGAAKISQAFIGEPVGGLGVALALAMVIAGGLVEGVSLGTAQSWAMQLTHPHIRRGPYVAVTVAFAGLGWAAASAPAAFSGGSSDGQQPARVLVVLGGAGLGLVMGCLLGAVQAWVLMPSVTRPRRWINANAIAWVPAMAVIFFGATAPQADWSWWSVVLAGALTGGVAGTILGFVLGRWVPRLNSRRKE